MNVANRISRLFLVLGLLLITAWIYARALGFGFIWDDPAWFGRVAGKPLWALLAPIPDYHFYRPGALIYNRLFVNSDGTFTPAFLHAAQIGWHLLNVALAYTLSRRLKLGRWAALAVGSLVALIPFSYQAVAWAAPQQPWVAALQMGAWLTYLAARRNLAKAHYLREQNVGSDGFAQRHPADSRQVMAEAVTTNLKGLGIFAVSQLLFLAALASQESTVALAVVPLLLEWVLPHPNPPPHALSVSPQGSRGRPREGGGGQGGGRLLPLTYLFIAAVYVLIWLQIPRRPGLTSLGFRSQVILYFLQGFIFPLVGRPDGYQPGHTMAAGALLALGIFALVWLLAAAWRTGRGRQSLFGLAFALLGIAPSAVGLDYSYVNLSSRLFYFSAPGVALMWVCALLPPANGPSLRRWWRIGGGVLLGLIALQSSLLLGGFRRIYAMGAAHMAELDQAAQAGEFNLLFINFPDRYTAKRPPYPMGYWGITLAPVSVELGAFPASVTGKYPRAVSRSMPGIDAEARNAGPYQVDTRGIIAQPDEFYQLARQADAVYLSHYFADGTFSLRWIGAIASPSPVLPVDPASACRLAVFGQRLCLQAAQIEKQPGQLGLTLTWLSLSAVAPEDTIFAHVGQIDQPPIAQVDGDSSLGLLPMTLWHPGDTIQELRIVTLPDKLPSTRNVVRVGVYNWMTGERLPASTPQGEPLLDNAFVVGYLP